MNISSGHFNRKQQHWKNDDTSKMISVKLRVWFYLSEALETLYTDLAEISLRESLSEEGNAVCISIIPSLCSMLCDFFNFKTFRNKWVRAILKSDADTMLAFFHPSLIRLTLILSPKIKQRNTNTKTV